MPTYEFRCPAGHDFEKFYRKISDSTEATLPCPECWLMAGGPHHTVLTTVGSAVLRDVAQMADAERLGARLALGATDAARRRHERPRGAVTDQDNVLERELQAVRDAASRLLGEIGNGLRRLDDAAQDQAVPGCFTRMRARNSPAVSPRNANSIRSSRPTAWIS